MTLLKKELWFGEQNAGLVVVPAPHSASTPCAEGLVYVSHIDLRGSEFILEGALRGPERHDQ